MELSGEEKKIQALFSELKAGDEQTTPLFGAAWNRAKNRPRKIRAFNPAFVAATLLLVLGVVAFAVWSRYSRTARSPRPMIAIASPNPNSTAGTETSPAPAPETASPKRNLAVVLPHRNREARQRNVTLAAVNRKLEKDAKSIGSWTSPTSALLESPSDAIFSSLPELNQSATQLKSFLPSRSN